MFRNCSSLTDDFTIDDTSTLTNALCMFDSSGITHEKFKSLQFPKLKSSR
jgi:hypothetical protein